MKKAKTTAHAGVTAKFSHNNKKSKVVSNYYYKYKITFRATTAVPM